jgi:hypothetical protein
VRISASNAAIMSSIAISRVSLSGFNADEPERLRGPQHDCAAVVVAIAPLGHVNRRLLGS